MDCQSGHQSKTCRYVVTGFRFTVVVLLTPSSRYVGTGSRFHGYFASHPGRHGAQLLADVDRGKLLGREHRRVWLGRHGLDVLVEEDAVPSPDSTEGGTVRRAVPASVLPGWGSVREDLEDRPVK